MLVYHAHEQLRTLAILVDKHFLDLEVTSTITHLHSSDKFRRLFFVVIEVPEADLVS